MPMSAPTLRRAARSVVADALAWTGADRSIARLSGLAREPLILGYHRVLADIRLAHGVPSLDVSVQTLETQLDFLGRRLRFVSLEELGGRLEEGGAAGLAAVTFDDGYADFYENAFPLLQRKGIPAAVFVVTGLLENAGAAVHERLYAGLEAALRRWGVPRTRRFLAEQALTIDLPPRAFPALRALLLSFGHDALAALCASLERELDETPKAPRSLGWDQLAAMSRAGLTVGSHTKTHALLPHESLERVRHEVESSRAELEERLGVRVSHFVYPDGGFDAGSVRAVAAAGYRFAYTGCRHRDPSHPLLTLSRRVLWEGSTLGSSGRFSANVLSGQVHGIFDFVDRCPGGHVSSRGPQATIVAPRLDVPGVPFGPPFDENAHETIRPGSGSFTIERP
jgi:peptidoglycan/xylan/chitin deacetylase (PgdA/CDA1 family)